MLISMDEVITGVDTFTPEIWLPWQYRDHQRVSMTLNEVDERSGFFKNRLTPLIVSTPTTSPTR